MNVLPFLGGEEASNTNPVAGGESFEAFVEQHYQAAYRFAYHLCGKHNDACDITQQAFYLAHKHAHQLRDTTKRKQWLFLHPASRISQHAPARGRAS